tara:strand:+ start:215 stop:574 length:360 start_codon:yes stop_codon:yes gene_type:complete
MENFAQNLGYVLILAFFFVVARTFFRGEINLVGLLTVQGSTTSPIRFVVLVTSIAVAIGYFVEILNSDATVTGRIPDIRDDVINFILLTNGAYLSSKSLLSGIFDRGLQVVSSRLQRAQ